MTDQEIIDLLTEYPELTIVNLDEPLMTFTEFLLDYEYTYEKSQ